MGVNPHLRRPILAVTVAALALGTAVVSAAEAETAERVLTIGAAAHYAPYSFLDENGDPAGYNVELTRAIARAMGINVEIRIRPWGEIREALEKGEIDAIAGMYYSEERDKLVDFSPPHTIVHHAVFARTDSPRLKTKQELRGRDIIVTRGDIMHDYVLKEGLSSNPVLAETQADALRLLASGKHDYALLAKLPGLYWAKELELSNIVTVGPLMRTSEYCFAVKEGNAALLARLSEGLAIIKQTGQYDAIYGKWLGVLEPKQVSFLDVVKYLAMVLIPLLLLLAGSVAWTWSLRRQVARRTAQLEGEIAERRRAEEQQRQGVRMVSQIIQDNPIPTFAIDANHVITHWNGACENLTGLPAGEMIGTKKHWMAFYPEQRPIMADLIIDHASEEEIAKHYGGNSRKSVSLDGAYECESYFPELPQGGKWLFLTAAPLKNLEEEVVGAIESLQDVTERKRAEEERRALEAQVQQAQKLESLGVLAGGIAHDFNNLLMAILGNADMALGDLSQVSPVRSFLEEIETASRRAADLCKQMLAYSGRGKFNVKPINVDEIVEEMAYLLKTSIGKKVALNLHLKGRLPLVEADAAQMPQVVMNLIINASEAVGKESGAITITTGVMDCDQDYLRKSYLHEDQPEGTYVYVEVADTGCGMDEETLAKIFDPFFTTKFTGRGLGLAAVLGIIRSHHGAIIVDSEPGQGTTCRVLLPAVAEPAEPATEEKVSRAQQWRGSGAILLVDDEKAVRTVAKRMLEKAGFDVLPAEDGRQAIEIYRNNADNVACVLLDLTMPHMDGEEALQRLRAIRDDVRVILTSGYSEEEITGRFAGKGIDGFIQKPYQFAALSAMLRDVLEG